MGYTPHVLVVGGGATGTGVARDLAMRGLAVTLVDRGSLASGTSGSMHSLLHSGARYAVDDGETAALCAAENRTLRDVAGHLVEETGGLFASLPGDPDDYVETALRACEDAGIPTTDLSGATARDREPTLSPDVERSFTVPDAVIDPAGLCVANARAAVRNGADVRTGWRVDDVATDRGAVDTVRIVNDGAADGRYSWGGSERLDPDYVVNAAGPWAGDVAAMAGLDVPIRHTQGAMVVVERAGLDTVVNRCRPRSEGDIAVPVGGTTVLGTTDRDVDAPDAVDRSPGEVDVLVDELADLVPDVANATPYRAFWGVRALPPEDAEATTDVSRAYTIVDHEARDDYWGMTTVFGGKLTIHRHVAEHVADQVCAKFGIDRPCRTADVALPEDPRGASVAESNDGARDAGPTPDPVLCESVGVRRGAVRAVFEDTDLDTEDDLRPVVQRTGATTGACQGGRCGHRLAAELYPAVSATTVARELDDLLAERWDGSRFACWNGGLARAARTYDLHARTLHRDGIRAPTADGIDIQGFDAGPDATGGRDD